MRCEVYTEIKILGNNDDMVAVIKLLLKYVKKYKKTKIERIVIDGINENKPIDSCNIGDLKKELDSEKQYVVSFVGPLGETSELDDDMFKSLAKTVPGISYNSVTDAMTDYTNESLKCDYSNKKLVTIHEISDDEGLYDAYRNYLSEEIKYDKFIELLNIDKSVFSEQDYIDMFYNIDTDLDSLYSNVTWYLTDENVDYQDPGEDDFNCLLEGIMDDIDFGEFEFDGNVITKNVYTF